MQTEGLSGAPLRWGIAGAGAIARRFCREHGLDRHDTDLVEFLVRHHLTMSQVAQKEDLSDPEVIAAGLAMRAVGVDQVSVLSIVDAGGQQIARSRSTGKPARSTGRIARVAGVTYKHVTYDGGAPAAVAAASGETQVTTQLAAEQTDMIRAKKIRPLAVVGDKSIEIEGYGTIPPLSQFIPGFKDPINYFGIFVPKGAPAEVKQTLDKIWATEMVKSEALKKYAQSRGAMFAPMAGDDAQKAVFPAIQSYAWTQQAAGKAKVSPDTVGIPKP